MPIRSATEPPRVYLDHAASTPLAPEVLEAMLPWLGGHAGNPSSVHAHGRRLRAAIEEARKNVAERLNCSPAEIVFTSGGTEADNHALCGLVRCGAVGQLISAPTEHHAVLHTMEAVARECGKPLHLLSVDTEGFIDPAELEYLLANGPKALVSLMHGNNETGTIQDVGRIAELCQAHGATFHSDTVQTIGLLGYDLQQLRVDFLTAAAHKFNGPRGVGFLYCRAGQQLPPLIVGGGQERNQRAGTEDVAGIVGLAVAFGRAQDHRNEKWQALAARKWHFWTGLQAAIPGVQVNGPAPEPPETTPSAARVMPNVLNVAFPGQDAESLLLFSLDIQGISASGGSACASGSVTPSHVLTALGHNPVRIANSVRFSFGTENTFEELDHALEVIQRIVALQTV